MVAADNSSLPEVVGEAGLLVDADAVDELSDGLLRLLTSSGLVAALTSRGRAQAGEFTWDRAARELRELYSRFAAG